MFDHPYGLVGAYALDALDPTVAARLRAHLHQCDRCCAELAKARGSIVRLDDIELNDLR